MRDVFVFRPQVLTFLIPEVVKVRISQVFQTSFCEMVENK